MTTQTVHVHFKSKDGGCFQRNIWPQKLNYPQRTTRHTI